MDESAQQAVQLGVNITIFVVALSISIMLMLGVRDVSETALEYDASLPTGSRVVSSVETKKRTISGDELISYYVRYIGEQSKVTSSGKFIITIENKSGSNRITTDIEMRKNANGKINETLKQFFNRNNIDISSEYEVITTKYNSDLQILEVLLKEI